MVIRNGDWIEWSAIWAEIIRVISKSNSRCTLVRFEITSMISDQNCTTRGSITTFLHPFWNCPNKGLGQFKYFIDAVLSRSENSSIFWGKKWDFWKQKLQNFVCNLIGYFKQALKSYWFVFCVASSLAGKKMRFKANSGRFVNKSHQLEPIRLQGPQVISKWV